MTMRNPIQIHNQEAQSSKGWVIDWNAATKHDLDELKDMKSYNKDQSRR
jgi:hypothetical protein